MTVSRGGDPMVNPLGPPESARSPFGQSTVPVPTSFAATATFPKDPAVSKLGGGAVPASPVAPLGPAGPAAPGAPAGPGKPATPRGPTAPVRPTCPAGPAVAPRARSLRSNEPRCTA